MKRILLLIPALNAGGAERVMVTLANEWSKENDVTILVFNNGYCFFDIQESIKIETMNLVLSKKGLLRYLLILMIELKRFMYIYKKIKNNDFDFILSFCYTTNIFASIISKIQKNKNIYVSERNDPNEYNKFVSFLINKLYKANSAVICQNNVVKKYFIEHGFQNRLLVLPNPVNFNDIPKERPTYFQKEIVTVGRLIEQKNQKLLIEAFKEISKDYPEYNLIIYGIGPLEEKLKSIVNDLKLEKKVFFRGLKKYVMYEVNKASVFVLSSNFEGFPNVLIEAMATGMPVISSNFNTGIAEKLIKNDKNGYLFKVGDKASLITAIKKVLERESEFIEIGKINKEIAYQYKDEIISKLWLDTLINLNNIL